jgi:hypothetical protein
MGEAEAMEWLTCWVHRISPCGTPSTDHVQLSVAEPDIARDRLFQSSVAPARTMAEAVL